MPRPAPRALPDQHEAEGFFGAALGALSRRPFDALAGALAAACTVMIVVNALALQQGRPAAKPAHDRAAAARPAAPAQPRAEAPKRSDLVAQVQTALAERELYDGVVDGLMGGETAAAIRGFEQSQGLNATGEASEKVLAALMTAPMKRTYAKTPKAPAQTPAAAPLATGSTAAPNPKLMATQRALAKIGYGPVTIDGKLGAETRNAIKAFERDRGMPETGEPTPPVLRALQAMTGAPLQ